MRSITSTTQEKESTQANPQVQYESIVYTIEEISCELGVDELNANNGAIRWEYNVNNIEISPIAASQVYQPAGTMDDGGELFSAINRDPNSALKRGAAVAEQSSLISSESLIISVTDCFQYVKDYNKEKTAEILCGD